MEHGVVAAILTGDESVGSSPVVPVQEQPRTPREAKQQTERGGGGLTADYVIGLMRKIRATLEQEKSALC